jgi:hypothetical protein
MQTAAVRGGRKPGRPRKYGQGRINATVRFTPKRYAALKSAAKKSGRSVSEEVETRIERSFSNDVLAGIERGLADIRSNMDGIMAELLQKAAERIGDHEERLREVEARLRMQKESEQ